MGVRLTGFSTPIGGVSWEYMDEKSHDLYREVIPGEKIKVFVSSICGTPKYDNVRFKLKEAIEGTNLAQVYLFEDEDASSFSAGEHYTLALETSDICIFLIDNADGINPGVQKEIDIVKKHGIKAIFYFCDEKSSEKTVVEKSLMGSDGAKTKTVHRFEELSHDGFSALINDIVSVYRYYCRGKMQIESDDDELNKIDVAGTELGQIPILPKTVLSNIDKCKEYILKFVMDSLYMRIDNEIQNTSDIDDWGVQFLSVLFEGKPIQQFNTGMFMEILKTQQEDNHFKVVEIRWKAIQAYFSDDISKCVNYLESALNLAKETGRPSWLIKDILIDLRNQHFTLGNINNHHSKSTAQKELTDSEEEVYYPILDRVNASLHEKYLEGLFKKKIESPYTVTFGNNFNQYGDLLASYYIISLYNGSLTHLLLFYDKIKDFLFYLSSKYDDWMFRRDMLKLSIFAGKDKEVRGVRDSFPEILNNLAESDASTIMLFCNNEPIKYRRVSKMLLGLGIVGYYLNDAEFKKYSDDLIREIKNWLNDDHAIFSIGHNIFKCLSNIYIRLSQNVLAEICCLFIDRHYRYWYDDMFKFIAKHIDLNKMDKPCVNDLISHIILVLEHDEDYKQVESSPQFLFVLRKQAPDLTEELDAAISSRMPDFYYGVYKLEIAINTEQNLSDFINDYAQRIHKNNTEQGKNGMYFGYASRDIATIRNIFVKKHISYSAGLMDFVIAVVTDTILKSKEGISEKIDAVSLLIYIVVQYPEDYQRNSDIYKSIYEKREEISFDESNFIASNIDGISLEIGLQFLFASMGIDTSADILELLPFVQNDVATTITVTRIIIEYLELNDTVLLTKKMESIVLQNTLQWIRSDNTDIRWNSTRILMALLRNPENEGVINHKLVNLVDTDNVYIKNLIIRNMYTTKGILSSTREYIISKCSNDPNYVVRMICERERQKNEQERGDNINEE